MTVKIFYRTPGQAALGFFQADIPSSKLKSAGYLAGYVRVATRGGVYVRHERVQP